VNDSLIETRLLDSLLTSIILQVEIQKAPSERTIICILTCGAFGKFRENVD